MDSTQSKDQGLSVAPEPGLPDQGEAVNGTELTSSKSTENSESPATMMEADSEYHKFSNHTEKSNGGDLPPRYTKSEAASAVPPAGIETHRRLSISSESDASTIDEDYDVASIASSVDDKLTWRGRMQLVLHSHPFHYTVTALVIFDALIVLFEFLLDLGAFGTINCIGGDNFQRQEFCHFSPLFRNICAAPPSLVLDGLVIQPEGAELNRSLCGCGYRGGQRVCIPVPELEHNHGVNPAAVLHYFSVVILSLFVCEVLLKIFAFRLKYFTHKFEVFDGVVVFISWTLDIASIAQEEAFEVATLLILLRLWRIIRIVNGSILAAKAEADDHLKQAKREAKRIIHAFHKARDGKVRLENENLRLRKIVESNGLESSLKEDSLTAL